MQYFATSDYHFGHSNIIKYCQRPFKNVVEMNDTLIKNHNERVKENDICYFLGDFCFRNSPGGKKGEGDTLKAEHYQKKLNGNITYVCGNHDNNNSLKTLNHRIIIKFAGMYIGMTHKPEDVVVEDEKIYCPLYLVGHVHNNWLMKEVKSKTGKPCLLINVSCDMHKFRPITFDEIKKIYDAWLKSKTFPEKKAINTWILKSKSK